MDAPRIPPLPQAQWSDSVRELLAPWAIDTPAGPYVPNIFSTLARNPQLLAAWEPFAGAIHQFIQDGLLEAAGSRVRLTPRGVMLSNEVFAEFVGAPACPS